MKVMDWVNILVGVGAFVFMMKVGYGKPKKKEDKAPKECVSSTLCGKVTNIVKDEETGLSCIYVRNGRGDTLYGFSSVSVDELKHIYKENEYVQIPIVHKANKEK